MGLWPSPRAMAQWLDQNWKKMIKGKMSTTFCGKGFYVFLFENKADRDLIFRNGPYFMGSRGMYLNKWTPDFSPENDIPSAVPVWVRFPFLPLHCWNDKTIKNIGNALGRFIDRVEPCDKIPILRSPLCRSRSGKRTTRGNPAYPRWVVIYSNN
jgi:hypothetical protein